MSSLASREARAAERHREQVARAIVDAGAYSHPATGEFAHCRPIVVERLLAGSHFDVARAREYGERLLCLALVRSGTEQAAILDDWTQSSGGLLPATASPLKPYGHGLAFARIGLRLFAALEGQPSECQAGCDEGRVWADGVRCRYESESDAQEAVQRWEQYGQRGLVGEDPGRLLGWHATSSQRADCPDCHGTGHNLHGVLPPVRDSEHVIRSVADGLAATLRAGSGQLLSSHQADVYDRNRERIDAGMVTRVVPRGEHRHRRAQSESLDERITERWRSPTSTIAFNTTRLPRWRRGELKHAEQRRDRERSRRRGGDE